TSVQVVVFVFPLSWHVLCHRSLSAMAKKTLLVVAPGLPEFDRHAGSRRLYSWLRILATEYHVALHVLQTRINADSKRYAEALRALGVEIFPAGDPSLAGLGRRAHPRV